MSTPLSEEVTQQNKLHYDKLYTDVNIKKILKIVNNVDAYLNEVTKIDTSWVCMYYNGFAKQIKGKKILELGCGNCYNASVMAALGAKVYANDISSKINDVINKINDEATFDYPIKYINGDFLKAEFNETDFDYVIGKAFVHHLPHDIELQFLEKIQACLKPKGIVRFVEPAVNNKLLDGLRWMVPVPGRPSSLKAKKFKQWKLEDPHPDRDNSGKHYKKFGLKYFKEVDIISIGSIERFNRLFPKAKWNRKFREKAYKAERVLPKFLQYELARTQTIIYKFPKK
ncbi:class I SAM-dependent methyltransferase [Candidatus Marifrigoribacter sp. Uisw_064]|jgi:2-polyprenyl-3-methyl-5-hydroxy-6-metoxy-1,4-benzoquinol methylase|uniref:class I SAM-dependent methyltransferase n=1 Tax=Candidatus Marifrigoribacter sp. Uisw_064 TaxID=3230970 RepID=UPI003AE83E12